MKLKETADALISGISTVIRGKNKQLEIFVSAYLSGGHVLLEDVPGLGKTTLAKTLAHLVGSSTDPNFTKTLFKRIQFTPDLLPYDITGVDIFNPQKSCFEFVPGPVFCDILLADEINRTTPKVQSALLEVMAEKQVTSGGTTYPVSELFFVVATQNPIESEGTYPLPAAELDRFMIRISLGYPDESSELDILHQDPSETVLPNILPVVTITDILSAREEQKTVYCHPLLEQAIISIIRETRSHPSFQLGVSPRGALHLLHAARTIALIRGRNWITDQDLFDLSIPVLSHRIIAKDSKTDIQSILSKLVTQVFQKIDKHADWSKAFREDDFQQK